MLIANATSTQVANAIAALATVWPMPVNLEELQAFRRSRLAAALHKHGGDKTAFGQALGYASGAYVRQMIEGERPISEKTVAKVEALHGFRNWFARPERPPLVSAAGPEVAVFAALTKMPDGPAKERLIALIYQRIAEAEQEAASTKPQAAAASPATRARPAGSTTHRGTPAARP